jgi:glycerol kinase
VEHDPGALIDSVRGVVAGALGAAGAAGSDVAAVGLTNQRETAIVWDRASGRAIGPAIVWQDRRTADFCERHAGHREWLADRTGLVLDPYFSATKFRWLLDHAEGARGRAGRGELAAGTVDSWLLWHLTRGDVHGTDRTNASRTLLMNLREGAWSGDLCDFFAVPPSILPEILPSDADFGRVALPGGAEAPILGVAGDQQASLFGQGGFAAGHAKCTYGTGAFLLVHTGGEVVRSRSGLLATAAAPASGGGPAFALEGSVFVAGAAVQWFRDGLRAIGAAPEIDRLYGEGSEGSGVLFVPALTGLGAPHWQPEARGTIFGLTRATTVADLARATIEGVAFQIADLLDAVRVDLGSPPAELRVDGGMARSDPFLQFQADLLGMPLRRSPHAESTALGAAVLAGLGAGMWSGPEEVRRLLDATTTIFEPGRGADWRAAALARWRHAVGTVLRHYEAEPGSVGLPG